LMGGKGKKVARGEKRGSRLKAPSKTAINFNS